MVSRRLAIVLCLSAAVAAVPPQTSPAQTGADSLSRFFKGSLLHPAGNDSCSPCLENAVEAINMLNSHGETLGFHWGDNYPEVKGSGTPNHWQGIQRLNLPYLTTPYFIVASSHRNRIVTPDGIKEVSLPAHFAVVQMASRPDGGRRLRSNRLQFGELTRNVVPDDRDKIVHSQVITDEYDHPGGMQIMGKYLLVGIDRAIESAVDSSLVTLWDLANPQQPRELWHPELRLPGRDATAVGIVRLEDGRYLMVRALKDAKTLEFYLLDKNLEISPANYEDDPLWDVWSYTELKSELKNADGTLDREWSDLGSILGEAGYQNINLVTECETGQLYLIASHGRRPSGLGGSDQVDAFRLDVPKERPNPQLAGDGVVLTKVAKKVLFPGGNAGLRQGDLQAAGGAYVSPDNQLYFYATEHGAIEEEKFVRAIEFAPLLPQTTVTMLNDAYVELCEKKQFDGRSIILDYVDRHLRDYENFQAIEEFDSLASSVVYAIPAGFKLRLYSGPNRSGGYLDLIGTGRAETIPDLGLLTLENGDPADNVFDSAQWLSVLTALSEDAVQQDNGTFQLLQNYPNPFNPTTSIRYRVFREATVTLEIFDIRGRLINMLVNKKQSPGTYSVTWDGRDMLGREVASGTYLYRLSSGTLVQVKTLTVLR